jgi:dTDP-glucose 4,6-dehydratase
MELQTMSDAPHLLVTGGAGFIGSEFVRRILARDDATRITVLDKLTYAGNRANLAPVERHPDRSRRFTFVHGDIADPTTVVPFLDEVDAVINFAAESHVDRSIIDSEAFLRTGVIGVHVLLEGLRQQSDRAERGERSRPRFVHVSTDEVYGSIPEGFATEETPFEARSPYAAAKAAGDILARSYHTTYGLDIVITRGSNTYGPYQHPEKLIPLFVTNALDDLHLPLYGDGLQRRDWLHVSDHAAAVEFVLHHGVAGRAYNVPGGNERTNREVVTRLLDELGKPWALVRTVEDRSGHDRRYAMDGARLAGLGWQPRTSFEQGLSETVAWYRENDAWWRAARSGDWHAYYEHQYGERLAASVEA